jgi:ABC-2 type transport system permease protein
VISHSYANVVSSFYSSKFQRHIEELLIAPVPNWVILAGYVGGGVARGVSVGIVVTIVSQFFTDISVHSYAITLLVFVVTSVLFATAGFINAVYANSFDDISIVPTFVLTPLTYLGGVFYSISMLPEFWQGVSLANPVLYMINAFRFGLLGVSDIPLGVAFGLIGVFTVLLVSFALWLLNRGVGIKS